MHNHPSACLLDLPLFQVFPFLSRNWSSDGGQWCWEQRCKDVEDPCQFLAGCIHFLSPWLCENSKIDPLRSLPPPASWPSRSSEWNSAQEGGEIQFSFPLPPVKAKIIISNLKITRKEKAHIFITHTSLSPELRGVRQLGPHSCHLRGQKPCQAALPLQVALSIDSMPLFTQPSTQRAKA